MSETWITVEFFAEDNSEKPVVVAQVAFVSGVDQKDVPVGTKPIQESGKDEGDGQSGEIPHPQGTLKPADKSGSGKRSSDFENLKRDSEPLVIYPSQYTVLRHKKYDKRLGVVELRQVADFPEPLTVGSDDKGGFLITHRTTHETHVLFKQMDSRKELPADVAAVIARAFLLAKISVSRSQARNILQRHKNATGTELQETPSDRLSNSLAEMASGLTDFISPPRDKSDGIDESPHKVLLALVGGSVLWVAYLAVAMFTPGSSAWLPSPQWVTPFFVALVAVLLALSGYSLSTLKIRLRQGWAFLNHSWKQYQRTDQKDGPYQAMQKPEQDIAIKQKAIEGFKKAIEGFKKAIEGFKKDIQKNGVFGLALASATSLPGALLVWLAWPMLKYGQHGQAPDAFDIVILLLFLCAAFIILLVAGNFQTHEKKTELENYEKTKGYLDEILSSFAQTNANVAALNFSHKIVGIIDEIRLREWDDAFQTKEAVVSLESVIRARQRYVHENVAGLLERQQRSRRTVLAAGSGMFAGFFTYEVGGSVMKYVDLPAGFDEVSYSFWMAMKNPQARSVTETTGDTGTKPCVLENLPYPGGDREPSGAIKLQVTEKKCGVAKEIADFRAQYHKDQLMDTGTLLIVTLIVSLVTAWVAVRKPEKEQSPT